MQINSWYEFKTVLGKDPGRIAYKSTRCGAWCVSRRLQKYTESKVNGPWFRVVQTKGGTFVLDAVGSSDGVLESRATLALPTTEKDDDIVGAICLWLGTSLDAPIPGFLSNVIELTGAYKLASIQEDGSVRWYDILNEITAVHQESFDAVEIGSIVEGVESVVEAIYLRYPFQISEFWDALEKVDEQAHDIWMATHGCERCYQTFISDEQGVPRYPVDGYETYIGAVPVDPNCEQCDGKGAVI